MSIERFFVREVTILHPVNVSDGYGDGRRDESSGATETTTKGWLHRLSESEDHSATRDADVSSWVLRLPMTASITSRDRVLIEGTTFEVDGPPNHAWTPDGEHHIRCPLRLVEG